MTLLFLKRLNDTFEENAEKLIKKGMNQKEAAYTKRRHYFYIPVFSLIQNITIKESILTIS